MVVVGCMVDDDSTAPKVLFDEFFRWLISTLDAGKGVARRVDLSTKGGPSPTFFQ